MSKASKLAEKMIEGAAGAAAGAWKDIRAVATHEFEVLAQRIVNITSQHAAGEIDEETAQILFDLARSQLVAVLAMLSTMIKQAVQAIINAALDTVKQAVNTAIGFTLIA